MYISWLPTPKAKVMTLPEFRLASGSVIPHVCVITNIKQSFWLPHVRIQMGDRGPDPPPPLKNHKNIGFLRNTGPDPL